MILIVNALVLLAVVFFGFIRNEHVHQFRKGIIDQILGKENWNDLLKEFDNINYVSMVLKFYKPLKPEYWYSKKFCDSL